MSGTSSPADQGADVEPSPETGGSASGGAGPRLGQNQRSGYHPRCLGQGLGVADTFLPIAHIFGGRLLSEDLKKADGY